MGRDKALLELDGATFLDRVVRALKEGGCDRVLAVVSPTLPSVAEEASRVGAEVLENPEPGEGPITSMRRALEAVGSTAAAVVWLPLDYPLVQAAHVASLIEAAYTSNAPLILVRCGEKRGHPVLFRSALFSELEDPTLEGGARVVVHRYLDEARILDTDDPSVTTDVDTSAAYEALVRGGRVQS